MESEFGIQMRNPDKDHLSSASSYTILVAVFVGSLGEVETNAKQRSELSVRIQSRDPLWQHLRSAALALYLSVFRPAIVSTMDHRIEIQIALNN